MSLTKIGSIGINTGIQFAGVTTVSTLKVGSGVTLSSDGDGFYTGVVTATSFVGDGSGLTGAGPSLTGSTNNTIVTVTGANAIQGEANLTFDGDDLLIRSSTDGRRISFATDGTSHYMKYDNTLSGIILNGYGGIAFETNGTNERLRIDSGGRVYIGTTTPGTGSGDDLTISNSSNMGLTLRSTTSNYCNIYFSDATSGTATYEGYISYNHATDTLEFATGHTERLRINSSGQLMLGTTTPGAAQVDTFTLETSGHTGMTLFSGTSSRGQIAFGDGRSGNAQYRGVIMYEHSNDSMRFATADTTQMNISSSGHITKPNQPMCSYDLNSSIQSGNYIIHNTVHTNNGTHYNTGNGRFVCPVAGYYYASIMAMTNNSSTQLDIELHKNGSNPNNILVPYNQSGGTYNQVAGSCIIYCAANDYLQFKLNSGSVYNGRHGNVSFALLA